MGWMPIEKAPNSTGRALVCGWQKKGKHCPGYWWWAEDSILDGKAIMHPEATYWTEVILPNFPPDMEEK